MDAGPGGMRRLLWHLLQAAGMADESGDASSGVGGASPGQAVGPMPLLSLVNVTMNIPCQVRK